MQWLLFILLKQCVAISAGAIAIAESWASIMECLALVYTWHHHVCRDNFYHWIRKRQIRGPTPAMFAECAFARHSTAGKDTFPNDLKVGDDSAIEHTCERLWL